MMSRDPVMRMIQERGAELVERVERVEELAAAGEGSSASVELLLCRDESEFLRRLALRYVVGSEMRLVERRCARLADELGVPW